MFFKRCLSQIVTPWEVAGTIDYGRLMSQFGCKAIEGDLISRLEGIASRKAPVFLRRGIFYCHK